MRACFQADHLFRRWIFQLRKVSSCGSHSESSTRVQDSTSSEWHGAGFGVLQNFVSTSPVSCGWQLPSLSVQLKRIRIGLRRPMVVDRDCVSQRRWPLGTGTSSTVSYKIAASVHTASSATVSAASKRSAVVASWFVSAWSSRACVK